jgi:hypothetical protein
MNMSAGSSRFLCLDENMTDGWVIDQAKLQAKGTADTWPGCTNVQGWAEPTRVGL